MKHPAHVPIEVAGPVPLAQEVLPEGVKPLLLIFEYIEVMDPVNKANMAAKPAKPAKSQDMEQSFKKIAQGV